MDLTFAKAFEPFYDETAAFTVTRREAGASSARTIKLAVPCCVLERDQADAPQGAVSPSAERDYILLVRRSDWQDHLPPQTGDQVQIEGRPALRVAGAHPDGADWRLECRSKEAAR